MKKKMDLVGEKFNRLTVIGSIDKEKWFNDTINKLYIKGRDVS